MVFLALLPSLIDLAILKETAKLFTDNSNVSSQPKQASPVRPVRPFVSLTTNNDQRILNMSNNILKNFSTFKKRCL